MVDVRRAVADGWAPSVSVALHAGVLIAALFLVSRPTPPDSGEKPIPVSLVTLPAPSPPPPPTQPVVAPEPEPPAVTSTAEVAPVAPPAPPARKPVHRLQRHNPPPVQPPREPVAEPFAVPRAESNVAPQAQLQASEAPVRSAEPAGSSPSYFGAVRQKLERNKIYPRAARQRHQQGTAILRFVLDRDGHVLSRRIEKSTGFSDLDREVEEMLERAQPLPPMPAEMTQAQLELVVPIDFHLR
ncbi:MAG TPA: energy transducer TonB [Alphaproteobacteria bacterium]|jgi:protein TonB|nr:energy transducer TonB [Alphaproteobacteria bacterium]